MDPTEKPASLDGVALRDLIALYRALDHARRALDSEASQSEIEKALIRDECAEISKRLAALKQEIIAAPVLSPDDALQALRFQLIEFGDDPAAAECAMRRFSASQIAHSSVVEETVGNRLAEIETQVSLIALALTVDAEVNGRGEHLLRATEALGERIAQLRNEVLTGQSITDAA